MNKALVTLGVVVGSLLIVGFAIFGYFNKIVSEGVEHETALSAQYQDNQNELSAYVSGFYEQVGIAGAKSEQMDKILLDAVKGRYDQGSTASPQGGEMFSAMVEAYPDLSGLDVYDDIMAYVRAGRESFKQKQSAFRDRLRAYDKWRRTGLVRRQMISIAGFPSGDLEARVGQSVLTGDAALNQMKTLVITSDTETAFNTGNQEPLVVPDADNSVVSENPPAQDPDPAPVR